MPGTIVYSTQRIVFNDTSIFYTNVTEMEGYSLKMSTFMSASNPVCITSKTILVEHY